MITILHTGQTGVERGADRAARAVNFPIRGYCQFECRDELGPLSKEVLDVLVPSPTRGARACWGPTLDQADFLVIMVPERETATSVAGVSALRLLARKKHVPHVIVDPASDLDELARDLRERELRRGSISLMVTGPRRTRWPDGERLGWNLVTRVSLHPGIQTRRVLVVDDHTDTAAMIRKLVTLFGHECVAATSGGQAIERARELKPDVGLFDIGLPDVSGYEVARQIRADQSEPLFLAAITGWDQARDAERAYAAGFDQHVIKPVGMELIRVLLDCANERLRIASPM